MPTYGFYQVRLCQGQRAEEQVYSLYSFVSFVGNFSGLALSIYKTFELLLGHYQEFVVDKSMLKMLYQEHREADQKPLILGEEEADSSSAINPKEVFKERIKQTSDFTIGYWTFFLVSNFLSFFCCCQKCCERSSKCCKSRIRTFKKF